MTFEKQVFGALRNEVGKDACNNILLIGDMNRNGWNDVVICGHNGRLSILKNGEAYRRWEHEILSESMEHIGTCGVLCDVTGNGYPDIVLFGDEENASVIWFENPGKEDKQWACHEAFTLSNPGVYDAVYAENLLGDNRAGILFTCTGENGTDVYFASLPDWTLTKVAADLMDVNEKQSFTAASVGLAVGDLDGDGKSEFVCGNFWFKRDGEGFTAYTYCRDKVGARIILADVDATDTLSIVSCERDAVSEYELPGATLSVYKQGLDMESLWDEEVLSAEIIDCGLLCAGQMFGSANDILVGEIGLEGQTSGLCTFKKPAHLGGFDFTSDTTRYLAAGENPQTFAFVKSGEGYEQKVVAESGLFAGAIADVLHNGALSLVGVPKIGPERWAIQCYTAIDAPKTLFG